MCRVFVVVAIGAGLVAMLSGCRSHDRLPDYLPREVVANQVGNAVVYEINDPRRQAGQSPAVTPSAASPASVTPAFTPGTPVVTGTTPRRTLYGQPTGVVASDGGLREVTLKWAIPSDEVYRYRIERAESPTGPFSKIEEVSPRRQLFRDTGTQEAPLKDNSTYYYQIVAVLEKGGPESIPSTLVRAVTAPPPLAPANVKVTAPASREVKITWSPSPSTGVSLYRVERARVGSATFERVDVARSSPLTDGGTAASSLKDSTKYLYRVITVNRVNSESTPSAPVEVTTLPPPAPVQKLAAVSDEVRCVPVSWAPSPESDVVRYDVYRARTGEGPFEKIESVSGRMSASFLDGKANPGNLEDEAMYFYRVRAVNAVTAESADSETIRATTRGVPSDVGMVTAQSLRPREIPISWTMNPDKAVVGYELWRAEEGSDEWVQVGRVIGRDTTNYLDRGDAKAKSGLGALKDGAVYQYKLIAYNKAEVRSSASSAATARTKYRPATPVAVLATTNLPLSIKLAWKANPEKDISDYVVECSDQPDDSFRKLVTVTATKGDGLSAREMALESGVTRYYRVKAIDQDGLESDWSKVVAGRSKFVPGEPVSVKAQPVGTNVRVTWKAPPQPDVRRYKVWRKKFMGWEVISTTEQTNYLFEFNELSKPMTIAVSAVDQDELEGARSESLDIKPGM